jgi:hypothetical protein
VVLLVVLAVVLVVTAVVGGLASRGHHADRGDDAATSLTQVAHRRPPTSRSLSSDGSKVVAMATTFEPARVG